MKHDVPPQLTSDRRGPLVRWSRWLVPVVLVLAALAVTGTGYTASDSIQEETVGIGLVLSSPAEIGHLGEAARRGAALAIARANRNGGFKGRSFTLVTRTLESDWSSGTEKIVDLAYRSNVWGLVGGLTGGSAHLIEQIVTKRRMVFLTPWASRESLGDIQLPWFYRLVPEDRVQGRALAEHRASREGGSVVTTVRGGGADRELAEEAFVEALSQEGITPAARHQVGQEATLATVARQLRGARSRRVALFLPAAQAAELVRQLASTPHRVHFLVPLAEARASLACTIDSTGHRATMIVPTPGGGASADRFAQQYQNRFDAPPPPIAAYTYDAVRTLTIAIRRAGLDRVQIQQTLADLRLGDGVTGPIEFDGDGNRPAVPGTWSIPPASGDAAVPPFMGTDVESCF